MSRCGKVRRKIGSSGMLLQSIRCSSTYSLVRNGSTCDTTCTASCKSGVSHSHWREWGMVWRMKGLNLGAWAAALFQEAIGVEVIAGSYRNKRGGGNCMLGRPPELRLPQIN